MANRKVHRQLQLGQLQSQKVSPEENLDKDEKSEKQNIALGKHGTSDWDEDLE